MEIAFVAGFGPIGTSGSHDFWANALGIEFEEPGEGYFQTERLDGVRAFAIWPLDQAARSVFGVAEWPAALPVPQAWVEFDVAAPEAVGVGAQELVTRGHELLRDVVLEPWGQWTARLLSPEGLLVGITYTPWMHQQPD